MCFGTQTNQVIIFLKKTYMIIHCVNRLFLKRIQYLFSCDCNLMITAFCNFCFIANPALLIIFPCVFFPMWVMMIMIFIFNIFTNEKKDYICSFSAARKKEEKKHGNLVFKSISVSTLYLITEIYSVA